MKRLWPILFLTACAPDASDTAGTPEAVIDLPPGVHARLPEPVARRWLRQSSGGG